MLEKIYSVENAEFRSYGRIIHGMDVAEIVATAKKIESPSEGSAYLPSVKEFEELAIFHEIEKACVSEYASLKAVEQSDVKIVSIEELILGE